MSELGRKGWRDISQGTSFSSGYDNCSGYNVSGYGQMGGDSYQAAGEKSSLMTGSVSAQHVQNDDDWKYGNQQK